MFPRLKQQLLARADLVVEFATLGEYGVDEQGEVMPIEPAPAFAPLAARSRDRCPSRVGMRDGAAAGDSATGRVRAGRARL